MNDISDDDFNFDDVEMAMFVEEKSDKDDYSYLHCFMKMKKRTTPGQVCQWFADNTMKKPWVEATRAKEGYHKYLLKAKTKVDGGLHICHSDYTSHGGKRKREDDDDIAFDDVFDYFVNGGRRGAITDYFPKK